MLMLILVTITGSWKMIDAKKEIQRISLEEKLFEHSQNVKTIMLQHRRYEKDIFLNIGKPDKQKSKYIPKLEKKSAEIKDEIATMMGILQQDIGFTPEFTKKVQGLLSLYNGYYEGLGIVAKKAIEEEGITPQQANVAMKPYKAIIHQLETNIDDISKEITSHFAKRISLTENGSDQSIIIMSGVSGAALVLGIMFIILIIKSTIRPINGMAEMLKDISEGEGDLTRRLSYVENCENETNKVSGYFNSFASTIQNILRETQSMGAQLTTSSEEGKSMSVEITEISNALEKQASKSADSVNKISEELNTISSSGVEISDMMGVVAASVTQMASTTKEMASQCLMSAQQTRGASEKSEQASMVMAQLTEAADKIGSVVVSISEIANKTDLLALNATIEAASAGDAGKGFAVVASEIKELSRQTQGATGEISIIIEGIRAKAGEAAASSEKVSEMVNQLNSSVEGISAGIEEMSVTAEEVSSSVSDTTERAKSIIGNIQQVSEGTEEISTSMSEVKNMVESTRSKAQSSSQGADNLNHLASDLSEQVSRFTV